MNTTIQLFATPIAENEFDAEATTLTLTQFGGSIEQPELWQEENEGISSFPSRRAAILEAIALTKEQQEAFEIVAEEAAERGEGYEAKNARFRDLAIEAADTIIQLELMLEADSPHTQQLV